MLKSTAKMEFSVGIGLSLQLGRPCLGYNAIDNKKNKPHLQISTRMIASMICGGKIKLFLFRYLLSTCEKSCTVHLPDFCADQVRR